MSLSSLNNPNTVCVISRGHSGSRVISKVLHNSGIFMGTLSSAGDLCSSTMALYRAAACMGKLVRYSGKLEWDFSEVVRAAPKQSFIDDMSIFLKQIINSPGPFKGWKFPQTNLVYPWLVKALPDIKYIHWIRYPKYCIDGGHRTDRFRYMFVDPPPDVDLSDIYVSRLVSWKYQMDIVRKTPRPKHFLEVIFEDFISSPEKECVRISEFLGTPVKCSILLKKNKLDITKEFTFEDRIKKFSAIINSYMESAK